MYHLRTIFIKLKKKITFYLGGFFPTNGIGLGQADFSLLNSQFLKGFQRLLIKKNYLLFLVFNNIICAFLNRIKIKFILLLTQMFW